MKIVGIVFIILVCLFCVFYSGFNVGDSVSRFRVAEYEKAIQKLETKYDRCTKCKLIVIPVKTDTECKELEGQYAAIQKWCDPDCPEQLEACQIALERLWGYPSYKLLEQEI